MANTKVFTRTAGLVLAVVLGATNEARADATHTYQDGLDGYAGTAAVNISSLGLSASGYGMNGTTFLDGGDWCIGDLPTSLGYDISPLVRFEDLAPVAGEHVGSATLRIAVDWYGPGSARVVAHYLAVPWSTTVEDGNGTGIGWRTRMPGIAWAALGAEGDGTDTIAGMSSTSAVLVEGKQTIELALDPSVVQQWIDDPSSNYGVVLRVDVPNHHVGIVPPLSTKTDSRPALIIGFVPGPAPGPGPGPGGTPDGGFDGAPTPDAGGCSVAAAGSRTRAGSPSTMALALLALALALPVARRVRRRRPRGLAPLHSMAPSVSSAVRGATASRPGDPGTRATSNTGRRLSGIAPGSGGRFDVPGALARTTVPSHDFSSVARPVGGPYAYGAFARVGSSLRARSLALDDDRAGVLSQRALTPRRRACAGDRGPCRHRDPRSWPR